MVIAGFVTKRKLRDKGKEDRGGVWSFAGFVTKGKKTEAGDGHCGLRDKGKTS